MTAALSYRSRALSALAVALPVPLLAALGLSLPLPATVERLAARLVPFGDHSALDSDTRDQKGGRIVRGPAESTLVRLKIRDASGRTKVITVPGSAVTKMTTELAASGGTLVSTDSAGAAPPAGPVLSATQPTEVAANEAALATRVPTPPPAPSSPQPEPTSAPSPKAAPEPTQPVVDTATTAIDNTVSSASSTVTAVSDTANKTVTTVTDTAKNTVGGLLGGHP